jgi:hypothetical protein
MDEQTKKLLFDIKTSIESIYEYVGEKTFLKNYLEFWTFEFLTTTSTVGFRISKLVSARFRISRRQEG